MINEIILQEHMNESEKTTALKLFKQLLTEKPEILKDIRYTPAQTIEQSCFISGGFENDNGKFDAIFFPNSEFEGKKNFICLAFQNGKACMVCDHEIKSQNTTKTWQSVEKLDTLIFETEELDEIKDLEKNVNYYNKNILTLEGFKRRKTKSGGDFKDLFKNFENGHELSLNSCVYGEYKSYLNIYNCNCYININLLNDVKNVTPDEIEQAIKHEIKKNKERIKETLNKIEIIHAETLEAIKIYNNVYDQSKKFKTRILRKILENRLNNLTLGK